jgi:hypothetical protein
MSNLLGDGRRELNNVGLHGSLCSGSSDGGPEGGVEALPGETDAEYVARQACLKEAASARMRAKFGSSGGLGGEMGSYGLGSFSPSASSVGSGGKGRAEPDDLTAMLNGASLAASAPQPGFVAPKAPNHSTTVAGTTGKVKVAAAKTNVSWDDFDDAW